MQTGRRLVFWPGKSLEVPLSILRIGIGLLCLCLGITLDAQAPVIRAHSLKELGNVRITTAFQDKQGWMWFGAQDGLYRYNGLSFQAVSLPVSLRGKAVSALYEAQGRVWVGFKDGNIGYLAANNAFLPTESGTPKPDLDTTSMLQPWQPEEGLPTKAITAFADDGQGGLWIATYGEGLYCWKNQRLYQFDAADDGLSSDEIYTITNDNLGGIWAATDAGISICAMPAAGKKSVRNLSKTEKGLPDEIITALTADARGNILIGTYEHGVCRYDMARQKMEMCTPEWDFGPVTTLAAFGSSMVWAGTANAGLIQVETASGSAKALPNKQPLHRSKVLALCKDREGLLWAVCDKGDIYSANVRFGLLETPFSSVQSVLIDSRNRLWVGAASGLFLREGLEFRTILAKKQNVLSLCEAPDGNIWVGTFGDGVLILSPEGRVISHLNERDGLANGSILSISCNGQRVWLATLGGVSSLDISKNGQAVNISGQNELGSSYVYKVFSDRKGRSWFATDGKGLVVLENGHFRYLTEAAGINLKTIYAVTEDGAGNIWFSTDKDGLFRYDGQQFQRYTTDNHLHSLAITGLAADGNGNIIIGYEDGMDILNPGRLDHVTFCDASVGAPAVAVNLNALCLDALGQVWLGSQQGILRISIFDEPFLDDPQPGITSVSIYLKPIDFLKDHIFSYNENYLIFNFTGLWYANPEAVRYRYRLDGFDPNWKVSKDHLASYPNLPPGNYVFRVQTSEHGNFDKVPETSWAFTIKSPFWARWWFVLLCSAGIIALLYGFIRARDLRLRRDASLKRQNVESQFAALKSQINPHFLFNSFNTLIAIIEENPKVAVQYVEHLSDFYRSIIVYRERDFIPLQEELGLVRNFTFLLEKRYEDSFLLNAGVNGHSGMIMPLSLQMLVENAVKHNVISEKHPLTIDIFVDSDNYVVVRNNIQRKIKPEKGTHFGLQSLLNRYQLIGERPVIVTEDESYFVVKVPLIKG